MTDPIQVPTIGPEPWQGELTEYMLEQITGGTLIPSQALAKRLVVELKALRQKVEAMGRPVTDDEWATYCFAIGPNPIRVIARQEIDAILASRSGANSSMDRASCQRRLQVQILLGNQQVSSPVRCNSTNAIGGVVGEWISMRKVAFTLWIGGIVGMVVSLFFIPAHMGDSTQTYFWISGISFACGLIGGGMVGWLRTSRLHPPAIRKKRDRPR